ncbi:nucleolar protein viriato isoform X3 [Lasioglossum baleicum]|uniref:nucleolar protein viriato isoform X3 n=1 Tax=Lasioglossum baleicum TaxID=434251 RepID=UPI003FCC9683
MKRITHACVAAHQTSNQGLSSNLPQIFSYLKFTRTASYVKSSITIPHESLIFKVYKDSRRFLSFREGEVINHNYPRFHKRKVQRQKKAQEELQQQLKEERKKIKQEARERYKNLVSSRDIPEIQQLLSQQEYETQGHTVSILELNVADLAEKDAFIGENEGLNEEEDEEEEENNENSENDEEIVGMTLNKKKQVKTSKPNSKDKTVGTRKDIKREIKKAALKHVQKSKAFQQKQNLERNKNKKESMRKLKRAQKAQKRSGKFKKTANR